MGKIDGYGRTVDQLLKNMKYSIDFYQREYKWQKIQICDLVNDLAGKFLEEHHPGNEREKVKDYPHYFLGPIIISKKNNDDSFIVDGQQRLTSLTLLLILLRTLLKDSQTQDEVNLDELILSKKFGKKNFNLQVKERTAVMEALYQGQPFNPNGCSESVKNIYDRYHDLEQEFPDELQDEALPYFIEWLLYNVHVVEITAYSDDDAYAIFETMNDRGLSLTPTDMLKGYLLANIDEASRIDANNRWRSRILELNEAGKEVESDFFKAWFRSQYATKIRERKRGAVQENFERIGTEFHRWLRETHTDIGLKSSADFYGFIYRDFDFYSRLYLRLIQASQKLVDGLEHVLYNSQQGFTLQYMLLLAPVKPHDYDRVVLQKLRLVGRFLDILLTRRLWNMRSIAYSTMQYNMFIVMRDIRGLSPVPMAQKLREILAREQLTFAHSDRPLVIHQQNRYALHRLLARITDYVETQSDKPSRYLDYVSRNDDPYEVEHIWGYNHFDYHKDEFGHPEDFREYRNRIGGLLLLPKSFNTAYGGKKYEEKLPHYYKQNLLASSLYPQCYKLHPRFEQLVNESGLPFKSHDQFKKRDMEDRFELYRCIAELIWNPDDLLREVEA